MARRPVPRRPTARRHDPTRSSPPGPAAGKDPAQSAIGDRATALAELERLYADLPDLACKGLCGHSCTQHVDASTAERDRLVRVHGLDLDAPTPDGACPALTRTLGATGSCTVHPHRPMICRLWGLAASRPCPHGCTPTGGHLTDTDTPRRLLASLETGGHSHTGTRRLLEQCMADPHAATLMAAMLRGDPTATPALHAHLTTHQHPGEPGPHPHPGPETGTRDLGRAGSPPRRG